MEIIQPIKKIINIILIINALFGFDKFIDIIQFYLNNLMTF